MKDFLFFEDWFSKKYRIKSDCRYWTFKIALNLFLQREGKLIVETGCMREQEGSAGWGAGCSTLIFGDFCKRYGAKLITVDDSLEHLQVAEQVTKEFEDVTSYVHGDSLVFFEQRNMFPIDLLYLDSLDADPGDIRMTYKAQRHQLKEIELAFTKLSEKAVVLLDDSFLPWGGKCLLAKEFLMGNGFQLVLDYQQSLWMK